jgi:hypothetical protein
MLRDVYLDDNAWLLALYLSDSLRDFLAMGFIEMRREPLGAFLYFFYLPFRFLENPFVVWHTVCLAVQIGTPLVLYGLVRNVSGDAWLGAFVAAAMIVVPLDYAVPYLSAINHRIGLLLGLASLYLTDDFARRGARGWRLGLALVLAGLAQYVFIEAAITLEPARLILLWNRLHRSGQPIAETARLVIKGWAPFVALSVPLVLYKLLYRPYGIYAGTYPLGFASFFHAEELEGFVKLFKMEQWRVLLKLTSYGTGATVVCAALAGVAAFGLLLLAGRRREAAPSVKLATVSVWTLVLVALTILLGMTFITFLARVPPRLGMHSTHAALMQPGPAILLGLLAYVLVARAAWLGRLFLVPVSAVVAGGIAVGVYFNNLNLDMFAESTRQEEAFWRGFKQRFPVLPERADFLLDTSIQPYYDQLPNYFEWEDLNSFYDLELRLVRMYDPPRAGSHHVRRYRVIQVEELMHLLRAEGPKVLDEKIVRKSHYGPEVIDPKELTVVLYHGGGKPVLVNREILVDHPQIAYRPWADKPLPAWATPAPKN